MDTDIVVIGGGHNGLTCGAYLARAGLKAVVIERKPLYGGGCSTEDATLPGFKHNLCSGVHTNIPIGPVYRDLELERRGAVYIHPEFPRATIFTDGRSLLMHRDVDRMCGEVERFSKKDARTYRALYDDLAEIASLLYIPWLYSPPIPTSVQMSELEKSEKGRMLMQWQTSTPYRILGELFESDEVKTHFLTRVTVQGFAPDHFGLGMVCLLRLVKAEAPICAGGARQLAVALANALEESGGAILTNTAVEKVLVRDGEARGVVLGDGRTLLAKKAVVSSIEPKQTFLKLVGEDLLPEAFVRKVRNYRSDGRSLFAIHLALKEPPKYRAAETNPAVNRAFSQEMFGDAMDQQIRVYAEINAGIPPREEAMQVTVPTLYDPTQAPEGRHTALVWQYAPFNLREGGPAKWNELRDEYAECLLDKWRGYAPNMNRESMLGMYLQDPLRTFEYNDNYVNGVDVVGDMTPDQLGYFRPFANWSNYRTPVRRLYMCGGCCHPGGGVSGAPAYNAAGVIADDLGVKKWWLEKG